MMTATYSLGTGLWLPVSVLFLLNISKLSPASVGVGISVAGLLGVLATIFAGPVARRLGAIRSLRFCIIVNAIGLACYPLVDGWISLVIIASVARIGDRLSRPLVTHLAASLVDPRSRITYLSRIYAATNLGLTVGSLIAGVALTANNEPAYYLLLALNVVAYLLAALLLARMTGEIDQEPETQPRYRVVFRDRRYVTLAALNMPMMIIYSAITVGIPLWLRNGANAPDFVVGVLYALNTGLVVGLQVRVGRRVERVRDAGRTYRFAGWLLLAGCLAWAGSSGLTTWLTIGLLVLGTAIFTMGEIFLAAGQWGVSIGLADNVNRAHYLGLWNLGVAAQDVAGPFLVTLLITNFGGGGWAILGMLFLVAGVFANIAVRGERRDYLQNSHHDAE